MVSISRIDYFVSIIIEFQSMNSKSCFQLALALCLARTLPAQMSMPHQDVSISDQHPRWGDTVLISYDPPKDSPFRSPDYHDTVYFTPECTGLTREYRLCIPMRRSESNAKLEARFVVPDSLSSISLDVCTPRRHFLRMIASVSCTDRNGKSLRGDSYPQTLDDSSWVSHRNSLPDDYELFVTFYSRKQQMMKFGQDTIATPESIQRLLDTLIARLEHDPAKNLTHELALSTLIFQKEATEHAGEAALDVAARITTYDPFLENSMFWGYYFSPHDPAIFNLMPARWRALTPLAVRFPNTVFAKEWLDAEATDSAVNEVAFQSVASAQKNHIDVNVWKYIADGFINNPTLYKPAEALVWADRAETASRSNAGFYSGADVFGGEPGILQQVLNAKAAALAGLHRLPEAIAAGEEALATHGYEYRLPEIRATLATIYLEAGRLDDAQRMLALAMPPKSKHRPHGFDKLYAVCKQEDESKEAFIQRLRTRFPSTKTLPPLKDFSFTSLDGKSGTLSGYRGKVVMIDFWFVGCVGCMMERESLDTLATRFAGDTNVVLLSIALSDERMLKEYLASHPSKFITVPSASTICDNEEIEGFPTHVIIGRDGATLLRNTGGGSEVHVELEKKIREAL